MPTLAVTDASGNVVDSMVYSGVDNGDSVLVPTGANYYVVITSDTGEATVRKWDSDVVVDITGSVSWASHFGQAIDWNNTRRSLQWWQPLHIWGYHFERWYIYSHRCSVIW